MTFDFDGDVPFCWQPENPEFAVSMNMTSLLIPGFEKYIVDAVRAAMPEIADPAVAEEADAFMRQEAQHARAHRLHVRALTAQYPGLKETVDAVTSEYDQLFASKPLRYHLAYIADLEATFTPAFKRLLDHADELFGPGDERVASLFLWHFTEEIEHRSSALILYHGLIGDRWYRLRQLPSVVSHINKILKMTTEGINEHVPLADRKVDARNILPSRQARRALGGVLPFLARGIDTTYPPGDECIPARERRQSNLRLLMSQSPNHNPARQPTPAFADEWLASYDRGEDVSRWFSSRSGEVDRPEKQSGDQHTAGSSDA
jgi:predicted metal-dependent hydrolase